MLGIELPSTVKNGEINRAYLNILKLECLIYRNEPCFLSHPWVIA